MHTGGLLTKALSFFGKRSVALSDFLELQQSRVQLAKYQKIVEIAYEEAPPDLVYFLLVNLEYSKSQQLQDLLALYFAEFQKGFFVEFGATNGIDLSNTQLLEKRYGWSGILAEPARIWQEALQDNRSCHISDYCVYSSSGAVLNFSETGTAELSTISEYVDSDSHHTSRLKRKSYTVKTISLVDLLLSFDAPSYIDFLSIDTEGSEFEILKDFDFNKFKFGFISVEHNFTPSDGMVHQLLAKNGYVRILQHSSSFDGWYVNSERFKKFASESFPSWDSSWAITKYDL